MRFIELLTIFIAGFGLLFSLLIYFSLHPWRIQLPGVTFARFVQQSSQAVIFVLFILIGVNLVIILSQIGLFPGALNGVVIGVTTAITATLVYFLLRLTTKKETPSRYAHLLAVIASRFNDIAELEGARIAIPTYGPPLQWMQAALDAYGISFVPVIITKAELAKALKGGEIDAALVTTHPLFLLDELASIGDIRFLPWDTEAIKTVIEAFPVATRLAKLPAGTYMGQIEDIHAYAPY